MSEGRARRMFPSTAEAVGYIHCLEFAHCNFKPENILLGRDLSPKLCDFGL
jgi:serine/threonine protein kinase